MLVQPSAAECSSKFFKLELHVAECAEEGERAVECSCVGHKLQRRGAECSEVEKRLGK